MNGTLKNSIHFINSFFDFQKMHLKVFCYDVFPQIFRNFLDQLLWNTFRHEFLVLYLGNYLKVTKAISKLLLFGDLMSELLIAHFCQFKLMRPFLFFEVFVEKFQKNNFPKHNLFRISL